ncbi:MAG: uracil-DNA glycosylase family protein [Sedimenticola sp.]
MTFTQTALKKLKKKAKTLARSSGISHAQALEAEARALGFRTYRALLDDINSVKSLFPMLERYRSIISTGDISAPYTDLTIAEDGPFRVFYAPFDYVNPDARVVLIGITPGQYQADQALSALRTGLENGLADVDALRHAKSTASFSGPMRNNLCAMLDHIGLPAWLSIEDSRSLFAQHANLVHTTSVLRYPVLRDEANYSGTPDPLKKPFLKQFIDEYFVTDLQKLSSALFIPLGKVPTNVMNHLVEQGAVPPDRVLFCIPHPSGANNGRIQAFLRNPETQNLISQSNQSVKTDTTDNKQQKENQASMIRNWTYLWKNDMWERKTQDIQFGNRALRYAAGDQFHKRGVKSGDNVFIVTVKKGVAYLGGVIQVKSITDREAAANTLGVSSAELWGASEFILPDSGNEDIFRPNLALPDSLIENLQLMHGKEGMRPPKRDAQGRIDRQTLRGIRELAPGEEIKLQGLLK